MSHPPVIHNACAYACKGQPADHLGVRVRHMARGQLNVADEFMCAQAQERHVMQGCEVEVLR